MKVAIIDADLCGVEKHRFPNLVCEKISAYWKEKGAEVELLENYPTPIEWMLWNYDETYISKVFTDTPFPDYIEESENVHLGGTGFYFDKAPNLPNEIEHHMPDYHLYDKWIARRINEEKAEKGKAYDEHKFTLQFKEYQECSIGFLTRGCFRKCKFCVNQKYDHVFQHSPLQEFLDPTRKRICLLDDNFLGCPNWKPMLQELIDTKKQFHFKQGLDERLLTEEKCEMLFNAKYYGYYVFAFDNIKDYDLIESKLKMMSKYCKYNVMFYVLVGFESTDERDIENAFKRIELLLNYGYLPYIMRYKSKDDVPYMKSPLKPIFIQLARWCNQPQMIRNLSFEEYLEKSNLDPGYFKMLIPNLERYFKIKMQK